MSCGAQHPVFIKVGRMGKPIKEYALTSGNVYSDALRAANDFFNPSTDELTINGQPVQPGILSSFIKSGDVMLMSPIKKNIIVKVSRVGERINGVVVPERSTVDDCLRMAGISCNADEDVWLHENDTCKGYIVGRSQIMHNGYTLILEKRDPNKMIFDMVSQTIFETIDCKEYDGDDELADVIARAMINHYKITLK